MSNTVYARIQEFAKTSTFKFHPNGINLIGKFVAADWRQQGGRMDQLDVIQSVETDPDGTTKTYMVYSYPEAFKPSMDAAIERYVKWCLTPKTPKIITEKPLIKSKPVPSNFLSSDAAKSKKRTRKPTQYPFFSGKDLKKK